MRIIFVRHGKDDERCRGGWSNIGLVQEGHGQAQKLADYLKNSEYKIGKIISSDLNRAVETAKYISEKLDLPIISELQLREINNGDLAGMLNEEALIKYPGLFFSALEMNEAYPNGESPLDFYNRIQKWFYNVLSNISGQEKDILVVTHGGVINIIYHLLKKLEWSNRKPSFPINNCSLHVLNCYTMEFETENNIIY